MTKDHEEGELDDYAYDREFWRRAYKEFIQNNDDIDAKLEEKSLYWNDDKDIVDTFVLKTATLPASSSVPPCSIAMLTSATSAMLAATGISDAWLIWT